ncbi:MAG: hypothetical protein SF187_19255 [Deltaproteobacteria bacterium]|nr:hypothetical protein [Deltaproteobacteria bacterium]
MSTQTATRRFRVLAGIGYFIGGIIVGVPVISLAQSFSTAGIAGGQPVSAAQIKANFDFLKAEVDNKLNASSFNSTATGFLSHSVVVSALTEDIAPNALKSVFTPCCPTGTVAMLHTCTDAVNAVSTINYFGVVTQGCAAGQERIICNMRNTSGANTKFFAGARCLRVN